MVINSYSIPIPNWMQPQYWFTSKGHDPARIKLNIGGSYTNTGYLTQMVEQLGCNHPMMVPIPF